MKTDSDTARPISYLKCFQKHVSVNYFSTIWDRILNSRHDSLALNFWRKQTHVMRSSNQLLVFISWATIQISAACCYGDVLRFSSRCRLSVFRGSFLDLGDLGTISTGFSAEGRPSGWCVPVLTVTYGVFPLHGTCSTRLDLPAVPRPLSIAGLVPPQA